MNKNLQTIFEYHKRTKHYYNRYAKSIGYMDWINQPDPFRSFKDALHVELPLVFDNPTPPYHLIFSDEIPTAPFMLNSVSQLFQFSFGISAIKSDGSNTWALRCNASSGNLQPTEAYIILPPLEGISKQSTMSHYAPKDHSLEILNSFDTNLWDSIPPHSFLVAINSVVYREVWKYGERAFRYVLLDTGHAHRSIEISAKTLGWKTKIISNISDEEMGKVLGYDQTGRFNKNEHEIPEISLQVSLSEIENFIDMSKIPTDTKMPRANILASDYQKWEIIDEIIEATNGAINTNIAKNKKIDFIRIPSKSAKDVILKRRSAQMMDSENSNISYEQFMTILNSTKESFLGIENVANLVLFVHNVDGLKKGLYIFTRVNNLIDDLKKSMRDEFVWEKIDKELYALNYGDFREISKQISCSQNIASDGAFTLGMLCNFSDEIVKYGTHRYKELYWECGAIGQQLYLEATSLNLSATGIGCFLDDAFHELLGLKSDKFQSLYHFTAGRALRDSRIQDVEVYAVR